MSEEVLEEHRRALVGLGYRMTGSLADAEDAAQEALLRLHQADPPPEHPRAWLIRVTTRLNIDRLRQLRDRREQHVGSWLPDFLMEGPDPAADVAQAESLSIALLVVLETLSPAERAAFVLHDVFGYGYDELAGILDRDQAACRQLVSRARRHLDDGRPRYEADAAKRAEVTFAFMRASAEGDMDALVGVLADDVVLRADSNGKRPAPRKPLVGPRSVIKFLQGIKTKTAGRTEFGITMVNGTPALVVWLDGEPDSLYAHEVADGRITAVHCLRDPERVRDALDRAPSPPFRVDADDPPEAPPVLS